ncbi:hypothetical protein BJF84_21190 [Rhodococcus sp. CUA-806]|nr:hypothetical protein BJF84_21190 [Rhodococcus sp. CUA-806]
MTALAPNATDAEVVTWLVDHADPVVLANLLVAFLHRDESGRNARIERVAQLWQADDAAAWQQFSDWAAHRAGT